MGYTRLDAKDWEAHLSEVHRLYVVQRTPVRELIEHFKNQYGLNITENQFKKLFRRKGWVRNCTAAQWKAIDAAVRKRVRERKKSLVTVNGREYDEETLLRELKRNRNTGKVVNIPEITEDWCTIVTPAASPCESTVLEDPIISTACLDTSLTPARAVSGNPIACLAYARRTALSPVLANGRSVNAGASNGPAHEATSEVDLDLGVITDTFDCDEHALLWASGSTFSVVLDYLYSPDIYAIIRTMEETDILNGGAALIPYESISARLPTISPYLHSPSWSLDGLRCIAEIIPSCPELSLRIRHSLTNIYTATTAELLDLAICCVISARDYCLLSKNIRQLLVEWFTDLRHRELISILLHKPNRSLRVFARNLMRMCLRRVTVETQYFALRALTTEHINFQDYSKYYFVGGMELMEVVFRREMHIHAAALKHMPFTRYFASNAVYELRTSVLKIFFSAGISPAPGVLDPLCGCKPDDARCQLNGTWLGNALAATSRGNGDQSPKDIIKLLVRYGADPTELCWDTFNTFDLCALMGHAACLDELRPDDYVDTPVTRIAMAAQLGQYESVRHIFSEKDHELALLGAIAVGCTSVVKVLLDNGVNPDCSCVTDMTPINSGHYRHARWRACNLSIIDKIPLELAILWPERYELLPLLFCSGATVTKPFIDTLLTEYISHPKSIATRKIPKDGLMNSKVISEYGPMLLCVALMWDDRAMLRHIFSHLPDNAVLNSCMKVAGFEDSTPIQLALRLSSFETFKFLWDFGGGLAPESDGTSEILAACQAWYDTEAKVRFLLSEGAATLCLQGTGNKRIESPLSVLIRNPAIRNTNLATTILELLLSLGADPNPPLGEYDLLSQACSYIAHPGAAVRLLLQYGSRPRSTEVLSSLVFRWNVYLCDLSLLQLLIRTCQGCNIDMQPGVSEALFYAARLGVIDAVTMLLEAGGDINYRHHQWAGKTPIEAAADEGRFDIVLLLNNARALNSTCGTDLSLATGSQELLGL